MNNAFKKKEIVEIFTLLLYYHRLMPVMGPFEIEMRKLSFSSGRFYMMAIYK